MTHSFPLSAIRDCVLIGGSGVIVCYVLSRLCCSICLPFKCFLILFYFFVELDVYRIFRTWNFLYLTRMTMLRCLYCQLSKDFNWCFYSWLWTRVACVLSSKSSLSKVFCKKMFLKISENSKFFIKKETLAQVFSCEFCKLFENIFFCRTFFLHFRQHVWIYLHTTHFSFWYAFIVINLIFKWLEVEPTVLL